jgi:hypothetical protein
MHSWKCDEIQNSLLRSPNAETLGEPEDISNLISSFGAKRSQFGSLMEFLDMGTKNSKTVAAVLARHYKAL